MMIRNPSIAFILNFIFPGLGLWCLKKWAHGFINLGVVLLAGFIIQHFIGKPIVWIATFYGIASGAWAYLAALEINTTETLKSQQHLGQVSSESAPSASSDEPSR